MGGLQAAFISEVLKISSEILESRRSALNLYNELYQGTPRIHEQVELVMPPGGIVGNGYLSVFRLRERTADPIKDRLQGRGIGCGRTYPETISQQSCCRNDLRASDLAVSQSTCKRLLNLPLFAFITAEECEVAFNALVETLSE
jgi:dTDP-4-amino-4,6-dideoxygalactose transaminase